MKQLDPKKTLDAKRFMDYETSVKGSKIIEYVLNLINKKNIKILDVGGASGVFLNEIMVKNRYPIQAFNLEISDYYKNKLVNKGIKFIKSSIINNKIKDNTFDIVYHKSVLEHVYKPANLMKETYRILRPGGKLIILTPDWHTQWKNFFEDFTHSRPYDVMALSDLLKIYGFNKLTVERFYQLPIVWKYPAIKLISKILQLVTGVYSGRWLTKKTGIKFFRWSVELMLLGYGEK